MADKFEKPDSKEATKLLQLAVDDLELSRVEHPGDRGLTLVISDLMQRLGQHVSAVYI